MIIREARPEDNKQLLELTRLAPMEGHLSLRIDRQPDFFALTRERGDSLVLVAEEKGCIVGAISASRREMYVNGEKRSAYLLAGFKAHPELRGHKVSFRLSHALKEALEKKGADLVFCTVVEGNVKVRSFLEGRLGFPPFAFLGQYLLRMLTPRPFPCRTLAGYDIMHQPQSSVDLEEFYHQQLRERYSWSPAYVERMCGSCEHLLARRDDKIVAALSFFDPGPMRQVVITALPPLLRALSFFSSLLNRLFPQLPGLRPHTPLRILNIRLMSCRQGQEKALRFLMQKARRLAWKRGYLLLATGLDERDPLNEVLRNTPALVTRLNAWLAGAPGHEARVRQVSEGVIFEDYSII